MKETKKKSGRREFLQGTIQALLVAPVAIASERKGETSLLEEGKEPLPGEPGYRDPEAYGSIAE